MGISAGELIERTTKLRYERGIREESQEEKKRIQRRSKKQSIAAWKLLGNCIYSCKAHTVRPADHTCREILSKAIQAK